MRRVIMALALICVGCSTPRPGEDAATATLEIARVQIAGINKQEFEGCTSDDRMCDEWRQYLAATVPLINGAFSAVRTANDVRTRNTIAGDAVRRARLGLLRLAMEDPTRAQVILRAAAIIAAAVQAIQSVPAATGLHGPAGVWESFS